MSRHATSLCLLLLAAAGCSSPAAPPVEASAPAKPKDGEVAAAVKNNEATPAADAGDHAGCIYVDGEKADELACPHPNMGHGEEIEPQGPETGEGHFGSPFTLAEATPLSKAIAAGAGEQPILVSGEVEAVCQKKGCWMVVKDGTDSARVLMKEHAFAVPMDCRGKTVTIEGTLQTRTFSEAQVKHLAKDGGQDPSKVAGERTEHVLTASGILIQS